MSSSTSWNLGRTRITRLTELTIDDRPASLLFPQWQQDAVNQTDTVFSQAHLSHDRQRLTVSCHSWLVQTPEHTVLIDTACGNDKLRPDNPLFDRLQTHWLQQLRQAGVEPHQVDYVLLTHLHVDHVGWNTQLVEGQWRPTFPNARYVFSAAEYDWYAHPDNVTAPNRGLFDDSVQPLVDAGQDWRWQHGDQQPIAGFHFHRTPGHSYDHLSFSLQTDQGMALFAGDVMHHPMQVYFPQWNSVYCEFPEQALASRRWALEFAADHNVYYFSSHFAGASVGRIARQHHGFSWQEC